MAGRTVRSAAWIPLVAGAALGVAACGDYDDDNGADTTAVADVSGATVAVGADDAGDDGNDGNGGDANDGDDAQAVDITMVGVAEGFAPPTVTVAAGTEVSGSNVDACHISSWFPAVEGVKLQPTSHPTSSCHRRARSVDHRSADTGAA